MSARQLRKLRRAREGDGIPPPAPRPEADGRAEDDEAWPPPRRTPPGGGFGALLPDDGEDGSASASDEGDPVPAAAGGFFGALSVGSAGEADEDEDEDEDAEPTPAAVPVGAGKGKKQRRRRKKKGGSTSGGAKKASEEDDIDALVASLNLVTAGGGQSSSPGGGDGARVAEPPALLAVEDAKHLQAEHEMRRRFGAGVVREERARRAGAAGGGTRRARAGTGRLRPGRLVNPSEAWPPLSSGLLQMELVQEGPGGVQHFRYRQSAAYQAVNAQVEALGANFDPNALMHVLRFNPWHVDTLLAAHQVMRNFGQHGDAADVLERALYALEMAWHPKFGAAAQEGRARLAFDEEANRPLFTALFQHVASLSRRGCHRTALECGKVLLSLDRSDPKGLLFCIDYFALRAGGDQLRFLLRLMEEWEEGGLDLLPNLAFNASLARFRLDAADPEADAALVRAVLLYPAALKQLLGRLQEQGSCKDGEWNALLLRPTLREATEPSSSLAHLGMLFAERSSLVWKVPEVARWLRDVTQRALELREGGGGGVVGGVAVEDWLGLKREMWPASDVNAYRHLFSSDFSDTLTEMPPDELPQLVEPGAPGPAPAPGRVLVNADANPLRLFVETLLPWVDVQGGQGGPLPPGEGEE